MKRLVLVNVKVQGATLQILKAEHLFSFFISCCQDNLFHRLKRFCFAETVHHTHIRLCQRF